MTSEVGSIFVGEWKDGARHGIGTFHFTIGDKYVGDWSHDVQHG